MKLEQLSGVDRSLQKVMFKGLLKESNTLKGAGLKNKSKLKLIGTTLSTVMAVASASSAVPAHDVIGFDDEMAMKGKDSADKINLEEKQHKSVLSMGPPTEASGFMVGNNYIDLGLPSAPLVARLAGTGKVARLTLKPQLQQLWIQSESSTRKLPLGGVSKILSEKIEDGKYSVLALQSGKTSKSRIYLYYVPSQFVRSFKSALRSGGF